jgi:hypothetical protein
MIIGSKPEHYDGSFRLVMYEPGDDGKCRPNYTKTKFDDMIETYYTQRVLELERLQKDLLDGQISPIGFYTQLQQMDLKGLAARMKISKSACRKHMTPIGFDSVKIEILKRYAKVFNIAVSDFFQFTYLKDDFSVELERFNHALLQKVTIAPKK